MKISSPRMQKLLELLQEEPDDLFLKYALAMEYLGLADFETAQTIFAGIIERDETYVPAYYQLGKLLSAHNQDEAVSIYERGMKEAMLKKDLKTVNEFRTAIDELLF